MSNLSDQEKKNTAGQSKTGLLRKETSGLIGLLIFLVLTLFNPGLAGAATGTKYIRDDATGGDCTSIGTWDLSTKTCTLTGDLTFSSTNGIEIASSGVTLDGNGHTLTGNNSGNGAYLNGKSNVTIKKLIARQFSIGIYLRYSSNNELTDNISTSNQTGVFLYYSSSNTLNFNTVSSNSSGVGLRFSSDNVLGGNTASSNNGTGIYINDGSNNNTLSGNIASSNGQSGVTLWNSTGNNLSGNNMTGNQRNFSLDGINQDAYFDHSIDTTNLVDGKSIYYIKNASGQIYDSSTNAGTFYCISCSNVTIKDLSLSKNGAGIYLYRTQNSRVENVDASNNLYGVKLSYSDNNVLTGNTASSNRYGISLDLSSGNTLGSNTASMNGFGILIFGSKNNFLGGNSMAGNDRNFYLDAPGGWSDANYNSHNIDTTNLVDGKSIYYIKNASGQIYDSSTNAGTFYCISCSNVTIKDLSLSKNGAGIYFYRTQNSRVENVNVSNSFYGIELLYSDNNALIGNTTSANDNGVFLSISSNNILTGNTASSNTFGIGLWSAYNSKIYRNYLIDNSTQATVNNSTGSLFSLPAPDGGNYWSNFDTPAEGCHNNNGDDFCDAPYTKSTGVTDNLPRVSQNGRVDHVSPTTTDDSPTGWQNANFSVNLACTDDLSGCQETWYRVNGGNWQQGAILDFGLPCEGTNDGDPCLAPDGEYLIEYYSVDQAGNHETTKSTHAKLDKTPPEITGIIPTGAIYSDTTIVRVNYDDSMSGIDTEMVSLSLSGSGAINGCQPEPASVICEATGLTYGPNTIVGSVTDNAGNMAQINGPFTVGDNQPPNVIYSGPTGMQYTGNAIVTGTYTDPEISGGINALSANVRINGGAPISCQAQNGNISCPVSNLKNGRYHAVISITDNDGNTGFATGSFDVYNCIFYGTPLDRLACPVLAGLGII